MFFYCPKCGKWKKIEPFVVVPGGEIECPDCGVIWKLEFKVVYDPEDDPEEIKT